MDNKKKSGSRTTPDLAKTIGDRINEALALRDVKQKDLAKMLGVTDNTVSYYCSGSRTPNTQQITEIAKFLNVSADWLLGLSDNRTTDQATKELCETLGLSDLAIDLLKRSKISKNQPMQNLINVLTEDHFAKSDKKWGVTSSFIELFSDFFTLANMNEDLVIDVLEDGEIYLMEFEKDSTLADVLPLKTNLTNPALCHTFGLIDYALSQKRILINAALDNYSAGRQFTRTTKYEIAAENARSALQNQYLSIQKRKGANNEDS